MLLAAILTTGMTVVDSIELIAVVSTEMLMHLVA